MSMIIPLHEPVVLIVIIDDEFRDEHQLSSDAVLAVVELYEGSADVLCTDCETSQGIVAAARAWAEATGAAYGGVAA